MTRVNIAGREFGSTGAKTDPGDAKTRLGHIDEIVPYQNENFWKNQFAGMLAHYEVYGIAVWDIATPYVLNSYTLGSDGIIYRSLQAGNTGNNPLSSPSWWTKAFVDLSTNETIAGTKTFNALKLGGNQDANNKKITLLAAPTSNQDAANKAYVDSKIPTPNPYTGQESVSFANGLVFKQGISGTLTGGVPLDINFGTAFATEIKSFSVTGFDTGANADPVDVTAKSVSKLTVISLSTRTNGVSWQAWGR